MIQTSALIISAVHFILMAVLLIGGIIMMLIKRRDHGRAAVMGMIGCFVLLLGAVFSVLSGFLYELLADYLGMGPTFTITNLINLILTVTGTGLLIWAVVARRDPAQPAGPQGQGWQQPPAGWQQPQQEPGWQNPQQPPFGG
ncbi:hypothetical protein ITP53_18870 [Nonomuraea sp. K274]|uniref:Uncharacterized protein n=1 Tax=Nonomuraea cypriaca TaxID=1187855 RepID=A0A931EXG7_9ACTN|nr:hypothetical protein [Nonomuraea cypriaca]MBF8187759.1 hypothetical protein [Nonomuraea cypriaca]